MSSFLNKGIREQKQKQKKEVINRIKSMYGILSELDVVAEEINKNETSEITEDNLEEIAAKYSDINIGGYEKLILLSKLEELGKVKRENILKDGL